MWIECPSGDDGFGPVVENLLPMIKFFYHPAARLASPAAVKAFAKSVLPTRLDPTAENFIQSIKQL